MNASTDSPSTTDVVSSRIRWAVWCTLTGLICVLLFLVSGFQSWSVGIGVFLGFPLLIGGVGLYVAGVVRDLRRREAL